MMEQPIFHLNTHPNIDARLFNKQALQKNQFHENDTLKRLRFPIPQNNVQKPMNENHDLRPRDYIMPHMNDKYLLYIGNNESIYFIRPKLVEFAPEFRAIILIIPNAGLFDLADNIEHFLKNNGINLNKILTTVLQLPPSQ